MAGAREGVGGVGGWRLVGKGGWWLVQVGSCGVDVLNADEKRSQEELEAGVNRV